MRRAQAFSLGLALLCVQLCSAYYVPGTYPQEFRAGTVLQAEVGSLTSFDTELPYDYYSMPFCKPIEGVKRITNTANPGTVLSGTRLHNSPYHFTMKLKQQGVEVCQPEGFAKPLTAADVKMIKARIDEHYRVNLVLDNLPVTTYDLLDENAEFVRPGFELGYKQGGKYYINNHLVFNILVYMTHGEYTAARAKYDQAVAMESLDARHRRSMLVASGRLSRRHLLSEDQTISLGSETTETTRRRLSGTTDPTFAEDLEDAAFAEGDFAPGDDGEPEPYFMIVGFEVSPCSIAREAGKEIEDVVCGVDGDQSIKPQEVTIGAKIVYTYDVYWQDSKIKWASRWDAYLRMPGGKVHWFAIVNSLLVVVVMATIVAMILIRTVRRDLAKYEQLMVDGSVDMKDEAGWKLVAGDAFRPPTNTRMLAVQVGTGVQVIVTCVVTLFLATLGFLSPASRGALVTTMMIFFVLLSALAGFVSTYMWGLMQRSFANWHRVAGLTSVYYPGIVMAIFTLLNMVIHHTGSSGAVPIGMYFSLVAVWFLVSIPLCFVGGLVAVRVPLLEWPVKTNQIPRHIPPPPLAANPHVLFIAAGILPFGTVFIELYFAMTSVWLGYFYYLFGFVFVIGTLMMVINAEISILCTYVQLCAEDYLWWWRSFQRGGSVAVYITLYALGFMASTLTSLTGFMSVFIYLCYMAIFITGLYFATGTIGFAGSFWFVYKIFAAVKAD